VDVRELLDETVSHATGRAHRDDPVGPRTGGPAGNARLTAWTGLVLLVLFFAEMVTLLDVHGLVNWHVAIGVLLIPPALVKTGTTGWRIVRYYRGDPGYRRAGPPPMLLRLLGPLVVVTTLALLGTGLALVFVSPDQARQPFAAGFSVLMLHKASFVLWFGATGLHTLARLFPAVQMAADRRSAARTPGRTARTAVLGLALATAAAAAALAVAAAGAWHTDHGPGPDKIIQRFDR
jgi:hypothetical protein